MGISSKRLIVLATAFVALASGSVAAECSADRVDLRGDWGQAQFSVDVADEPAERSRGLMFVENMPQSSGMLFVYEQTQRAVFWMRNTLIPLDMIFADPSGVVTHVHSNAVPLDETPIDGGDGVLFVLEINGGLAERLGISEGSEIRHPAIVQGTAAWSCE